MINDKDNKLKTLALSELRRVAERTRLVKRRVTPPLTPPLRGAGSAMRTDGANSAAMTPLPSRGGAGVGSVTYEEVLERIPWRVWYVAASNGDVIRGEECVTLSVDVAAGTRLVQFTASGQTRRLRDCCILRADDFRLTV